MACIKYEQKRIRKLILPEDYDINKIQIGVSADENRKRLLGLKNIGDVVLPSGDFGSTCKKNAYGYSYTDKTQPKENRYITTNWIYPYGNRNASPIACNIFRECYPRVDVDPQCIEIILFENKEKNQYLIASLSPDMREKYLIETVNIFLEIFGQCCIYSDELDMREIKRSRCNWEILPPGERPSKHMSRLHTQQGKDTNSFNISRLNEIEKYKYEEVVEGINGFKGYYAYIFKNCCVLESAMYGNATYIIPKEDWKRLSQKTKKELLDNNNVIEKIDHKEKWKNQICSSFKKLNIT